MEIIKRSKKIEDVNMLSPLVWAYIGDSVYELFIRTNLVNTSNAKPHKLHIESIKYVKAKAQADILEKIYDVLTDKEKDIVVNLFRENEDELIYILETPNHNTGNLITNLAKLCNVETVKNENDMKIIYILY